MYTSFFGNLSLLTRDYPGAPPAPPAPPAPAPTPSPPPTVPLAFAVVTRASLFALVGVAVSSTIMATVTCTDTTATIAQSVTVPGLTFSYAGNVLTVAGTPTGNARVYRVVVSYIATGSSTVLGTSEHEVTIANAAQVLTIGSMAGAAGRVGYPLSAILCSPTSNYAVDVIAQLSGHIDGYAVGTAVGAPPDASLATSLAWTKGASSGSGALTLTGTPATAGTYTIAVSFYCVPGYILLGTSTHQVVIAAAYEVPTPAPAPAPSPAPPAPSPPPAPTPAPAPGHGADSYLTSTKFLLHFNNLESRPGGFVPGNTDVSNAGRNDAVPAQNYFNAPWCEQEVQSGLGLAQRFGYSTTNPEGFYQSLASRSYMEALIYGADGSGGALTVECLVNVSAASWSELTAFGGDVRYMPCITHFGSAENVLWTLGFGCQRVYSARGQQVMHVFAAAWCALLTSGPSVCIGRKFVDRPNRLVHLATSRMISGASALQAVWLDGDPGENNVQATGFVAANPGKVRLGGAIPRIEYLVQGVRDVTIIPFAGTMDEARGTAASRYSAYVGATTPTAIPLAARVIPWPNY